MKRRVLGFAVVVLASVVPVAQAQVKLEYKFPEGRKSQYRAAVKTHQILSLMGMDIETDSDQSTLTEESIGKRNEDGTLPVSQTLESLRIQLSLPGGLNVTYDSTDPKAKIDNPQLAFLGDLFKALVGVKHTVVLDAKDKLKFVEGTEDFDAKLDKLDPQAAAALRGRLSPEKLKRAFEQEHSDLPNVLARQGETWETTKVLDLEAEQTLTFRNRYEYLGTVEKDGKVLDKIGVRALSVVYAIGPNSTSPLKVNKSDLKIESSDGTILFDRDAGQTFESKSVTRIKGDLTLVAGEKELPSTLDLTLDIAGVREKPAAK